MVLYSKACRKCNATEKRREEAEEYECSKNFEGSSKSMEASAILKMLEDAFYNRFFIIDVIVSNNDSYYELCSSIHTKLPEVKFLSHRKESFMKISPSHPSLQIPPIA